MSDIVDQPPPVANTGAAIWDLVIDDVRKIVGGSRDVVTSIVIDMRERDALGAERYGVRLQSNNGRNALVDSYQEFLDGAVYLRQAIAEGRDDLWPTYMAALDMVLEMRMVLQ